MQISRYKLLFSKIITGYWPWVIGAWFLIAFALYSLAPAWNDIAADGDLAFLPPTVPSAVGQRALEEAFPGAQSKSQMVLVFAREDSDLTTGDLTLALDVTRRLHWMAAKSAWRLMHPPARNDLNLVSNSFSDGSDRVRDSVLVDVVRDNLTEAIEIEAALSKYMADEQPATPFLRLPDAHEMRGRLLEQLGESEAAAIDLSTAELIRQQPATISADLPNWAGAVRDVWSWRSAVVGHKLGSGNSQARLVTMQLATDFTATTNIDALNGVEALIEELRNQHAGHVSSDLKAEVSGSAAVGADMLRAAASGVRKTEIVTIVLVLLILAMVYRAPFLVAIPLTSIALSLLVATNLVALLARDPHDPTSWGLGVFTTTRIFIVVLLFGAGTDFCLFFLARNRELLQERLVRSRKQMHRMVASGWRSVHDALVASALTTIVGLALMWFSHFEKFQFSGPIIAISLAVTLLVCLTFTPALLSGLGRIAFWPLLRKPSQSARGGQSRRATHLERAASLGRPVRYWGLLASRIVGQPAVALAATLAVLAIPAVYGVSCLGHVTYDLTEELSETSPSRRGAKLISNYFPTRDGSPVTVLLTRQQPFDSEEQLRSACSELSTQLYAEGVDSVRGLTDPLGDYPPGKRMGLFAQDAWRRRVLLGHRITHEQFVSSVSSLSRRVAKFDVVLTDNPFSLEAGATLSRLRQILDQETSRSDSPWTGAEVAMSGTTAGISDLRFVTQTDQRRIQVLVTLGVWFVLILLLRQVVLSTYLIFTVLLSYFATLGITYWTFASIYGSGYSGLDWKVPLFLFVILVAVGQDYNVYLVTRIFEERRMLGMREAVQRALQMTGGIITSCGFVMAGTFVAMTSPAVLQWLGNTGLLPAGWFSAEAPVLRGITELGFALAFGVLLDTLVVRSILVPSFVVLWNEYRRPLKEVPVKEFSSRN